MKLLTSILESDQQEKSPRQRNKDWFRKLDLRNLQLLPFINTFADHNPHAINGNGGVSNYSGIRKKYEDQKNTIQDTINQAKRNTLASLAIVGCGITLSAIGISKTIDKDPIIGIPAAAFGVKVAYSGLLSVIKQREYVLEGTELIDKVQDKIDRYDYVWSKTI